MTFKLAGDFIQIKSFDFHHYQTDLICCLILSNKKLSNLKKVFLNNKKSFFFSLSTQLSTKYVTHEIINLQYVIKAQLNITKAIFFLFLFKTIEQFLILKVEAIKDTSSHL